MILMFLLQVIIMVLILKFLIGDIKANRLVTVLICVIYYIFSTFMFFLPSFGEDVYVALSDFIFMLLYVLISFLLSFLIVNITIKNNNKNMERRKFIFLTSFFTSAITILNNVLFFLVVIFYDMIR